MPIKYTHKDGSETIVKQKHYKRDETTLKMKEISRPFSTMFISVANGCKIGCKMCHLTNKSENSYLLKINDIISNNKPISNSIKRPIKISFMGMGEGVFYSPYLNSIAILIAKEKLYGVDIGTMLPFISNKLLQDINNLYNGRIFYSLHSALQKERDKLINSKVRLRDAKNFLQDIVIQKICHYTVIGNINDSDKSIRSAIKFCDSINAQLRIVEFNKINGFQKSNRIEQIAEILRNECNNYKLCYSTGKRMKAACGMFF